MGLACETSPKLTEGSDRLSLLKAATVKFIEGDHRLLKFTEGCHRLRLPKAATS